MKRPFDLVSFLQQERRVEQLENLKEVLADTSSLDKVVDKHEPDLEARFYDKDSDCQKAGQPLTGVANLTLEWSKMVINGQKWSKMVTNGHKWSQMVTYGQKWS